MNESLHMKPYPDIPGVGLGRVMDRISLSCSHFFLPRAVFYQFCFLYFVLLFEGSGSDTYMTSEYVQWLTRTGLSLLGSRLEWSFACRGNAVWGRQALGVHPHCGGSPAFKDPRTRSLPDWCKGLGMDHIWVAIHFVLSLYFT